MGRILEGISSYFQFSHHKVSFKTEIVAGLTTFSTVAYIIFVNPGVLSQTGMDYDSVMVATCLAAGIGTLLTGILSNYPFAQAPGMGLNAFFAYTVVMQSGYTWQQALGIVFISGIFFVGLTLSGLRAKIIEAFPIGILRAIPVGIGLFIAFIGLNTAGIIKVNQGPVIGLINSQDSWDNTALIENIERLPSQILEFGDFSNPMVLLAVLGFVLMVVFRVMAIHGAILLSILLTTLIGIILGFGRIPDGIISVPSMAETFLKLDIQSVFQFTDGSLLSGIIDVLTLLIAFTMVDLFDTLGTLYGTAERGGFLTKEGRLPRINKALISDALATVSGALFGTSTTTTYIESSTGIAAGGRTGFVSLVVASLFFLSIFFTPLVGMIPSYATAPALIMVGALMISAVKKIDFEDLEVALPAFLVIVLIPFAYGIADGIGAGIILYCVIQAVKFQWTRLNPIVVVIALLFLMKFWLIG